MFFHQNDKIALPRVLELKPIQNPQTNDVVAVSLVAYEYQEYSVLFNLLKQNQHNTHLKK